MLVSGKNVIAIDGVKTGNTLKGDGVFNTPGSKLDVNTDVIATKEFVTTEDEKVVGKINAASATLSSKIDGVSSKLTTSAETLSANKQDKLTFSYNNYDEITAINTSALAGGNKVKIESTNSSVSITATTAQDTGLVTYDLSVSSETIINPTDVKGKDGIYATTAVNGDKTTFTLGLSSNYLDAIKKVSSNSAAIVDLQNNKLDKTASSNFYPMEGNPSGFLTAHQSLSSYYTKQQVDNKFSATSSWANTTFLTKNDADGLYYPLNTNPKGYLTESDISADKWNSVYTTVNTASGGWNLISSVSALTGIQNFKQLLIYKEGQQGVQYTIEANGSAASLSFVQGDNISLTTAGESIKLSAKDTTYSPGNYIEIVTAENNKINAVGLQPSGDYVSATDFNEFKEQVQDEFEQTSAWVKDNFLSANALDEIKALSGKWDAASDEVTSHSANWNSVYETVQTNSGDWEEITKVKTFKTIGGIDAETSADIIEFSAGENIKIGVTEDKKIYISSHDTTYDENDFISASHLDNIVSVSANVTSNSADWTSAARALEASAGKWSTTHEQFNTSSVKWNEIYDEYQVSSKLWNDTTDVVNTFSGDWNEVSAKANSADLVELSGKVETLSGELETASALIEDQIDVLSGAIDNISAVFSADIDYLSGTINDKLDTTAFEAWSANADVTPYSAGKGLALNGHEFYVSADYAMSADVYNKDEVDEKIAKFGGYTTANADESGYPVVAKPSTKFIYLVKMSNLPASSDNYKEWIYTSAGQTTAWECIGETTLDLSPYLTKDEAAHTYQPSGYYVTSSTQFITGDKGYVLANDGQNVVWSGIDLSNIGKTYNVETNTPNYLDVSSATNNGLTTFTLSAKDYPVVEVSSTNSSIGIEKTITDNKVVYDLSVESAPEIYGEYLKAELDEHEGYKISGAIITGENGVSAQYDEQTNTWNVGLEDKTYNYFGAQINSTTTTSTEETLEGYTNQTVVGDKIIFEDDTITLTKGLYHVDIQVEVTTPITNNYYNVELYPNLSNAKLLSQFDASYSHTDTLDLSFDVNLETSNGVLTFTLKGLPVGSTYFVRNLQIFEVLTIDAVVEGVGGQYTGGDAIGITNDNKINLKYDSASGLDVVGDKLIVKLGEGLKFDTSGAAAGSLSLSNVAQDVIDTVDKMANDLDEKVTVSMPFNSIVGRGVPTDFQTGKNRMIGQLFSVAINNDLRVGDTVIEVFGTDTAYTQSHPIFGLYEYDFDYPRYDEQTQEITGYGRTLWVCDTGPVTCTTGKMQFPITHLNPECAELKASRVYYATIAIAGNAGAGPQLAGCPGYNQTFNANPVFTTDAQDITTVDFTDPSGTLSGTGFWQNSYHEEPAAYRFFMQIRNKKRT